MNLLGEFKENKKNKDVVWRKLNVSVVLPKEKNSESRIKTRWSQRNLAEIKDFSRLNKCILVQEEKLAKTFQFSIAGGRDEAYVWHNSLFGNNLIFTDI